MLTIFSFQTSSDCEFAQMEQRPGTILVSWTIGVVFPLPVYWFATLQGFADWLDSFDQTRPRQSLELIGNEISASEVEKLFTEHFAERGPKRLSEFQLRACNQPAKAIIGLALEML